MFSYKRGDIFKENTDALVNTVNCVGVMGRGLALQFKKLFPWNFEAYKTACKQNEVVPGKMFVYETGAIIGAKYIINFPTKRHWVEASRMDDIESGLQDLARVIFDFKIQSISIPPLGCGLGGLDWKDVRKGIEDKLYMLSGVDIVVFEPIDKNNFFWKKPLTGTPKRCTS